MDFTTIVESSVKFRDCKKWKLRWCVMRKLSPVADRLHLQLYRNERECHKQGRTKASLSLQHFLGLEVGFTLDKESNTMAIICQDVIVVLAYGTRELLIQWQMKIHTHLGEGTQFLIQVLSYPQTATLQTGAAKLHIQKNRFCLTTGVPPKLMGSWEIKHLRRFGVTNGKFCFEGGSLCGHGEGLYIFLTDQGDEITRNMQLASERNSKSSKLSLLNSNAVVVEQLACNIRNGMTLKNKSHLSSIVCNKPFIERSYKTNNKYEDFVNSDAREWPFTKTQCDNYRNASTCISSPTLAESLICTSNSKINEWKGQRNLSGCGVGSIGGLSRCSMNTDIPGSVNNDEWLLCTNEIRKRYVSNDLNHASCEVLSSKNEHGNYPFFRQHSSAESIWNNSTSASLPLNGCTWRTAKSFSGSPPCRSPKLLNHLNQEHCGSQSSSVSNETHGGSISLSNGDEQVNKLPSYMNFQQQTCNCELTYKNNVFPMSYENDEAFRSPGQFYDTPRSIRLSEKIFPNYDVPPAVHINGKTDAEKCSCQQSSGYSSLWLQSTCRTGHTWSNAKIESNFCKNAPVYARVDLSKKYKNRLAEKMSNERLMVADNCYTNLHFYQNRENIERLKNLNYMNLEFTNSLRYYENLYELSNKMRRQNFTIGIERSNSGMPVTTSNSKMNRITDSEMICCQCANMSEILMNSRDKATISSGTSQIQNYVSMLPLKRISNGVTTTLMEAHRKDNEYKNNLVVNRQHNQEHNTLVTTVAQEAAESDNDPR